MGIIQGKVAEPEYYPLGETYFIDTIDPSAGNDWNYAQHKKNVAVPKTSDFKSAVYEHLAWEVASALKSQAKSTAAIRSTDEQLQQLARTFQVARQEFKIEELFEKVPTKKLSYKAQDLKGKHDDVYCLPALTAGIENQGLAYYVPRQGATILKRVISVSANGANTGAMFYQPNEFTVLQDSYSIRYKHQELTDNQYLYFVAVLQISIRGNYDWSHKANWERIKSETVNIPVAEGQVALNYIECIWQ